jgi:hypothetical protein
LFFFEPKTVNRLFLKSKPLYLGDEVRVPKFGHLGTVVFVVYLLIHLALPVRHYFFKDDVLWTEEGHRLAWRMMLRTKSGRATFTVKDKNTGEITRIKLSEYLSTKQIRSVSAKPDFIWQFAQRLKDHYAAKGQDVQVFARVRVSVNGKPFKLLVDGSTDLAAVPWEHLKHSEWLLPSK